jgi:hypothetical protein
MAGTAAVMEAEATGVEATEAVITEEATAVTGAEGVDTTVEATMAARLTTARATTTDIMMAVHIIITGPSTESLSVLADAAGMATVDIIIMDAGKRSVSRSQSETLGMRRGGPSLHWIRPPQARLTLNNLECESVSCLRS